MPDPSETRYPSALTIDANVWVAAADRSDTFFQVSRQFLGKAARQRLTIYLPSFAQLEIACALARKRRNAEAGRKLALAILASPQITHIEMDAAFLGQAILIGTQTLLRVADTLYAVTAAIYHTQLISWDAELVNRAGADAVRLLGPTLVGGPPPPSVFLHRRVKEYEFSRCQKDWRRICGVFKMREFTTQNAENTNADEGSAPTSVPCVALCSDPE